MYITLSIWARKLQENTIALWPSILYCTVEPVICGQHYIFQILCAKGRCPSNRGVAMIPSIINTIQMKDITDTVNDVCMVANAWVTITSAQ